ncbi:hypothetical protein BCR33DRAFT_735147 [Rhizoclosmatium globosum]|uniref:Queuosine 5'-phosphate N-glycosylase/hydrolase n=1 Tax=Rhizoclosmatium globosum TaxID=329046 RepID=A0A1Y2CPP2_9FUNG|nr:hypothetical protein BCR33DRAFT_735147 [Rhizoclosmatium globosum]|eukprot:ORY48953.1 hypothetical protein BCR33DRAFT_735147 [Rhizoclosmatium globosum]
MADILRGEGDKSKRKIQSQSAPDLRHVAAAAKSKFSSEPTLEEPGTPEFVLAPMTPTISISAVEDFALEPPHEFNEVDKSSSEPVDTNDEFREPPPSSAPDVVPPLEPPRKLANSIQSSPAKSNRIELRHPIIISSLSVTECREIVATQPSLPHLPAANSSMETQSRAASLLHRRQDYNPFALPLKFDSPAAELDVLGITCALGFGSGYREELMAALERGPFDTVRFGVMSMYISQSGGLTASGMKELGLGDVAGLFGVPLNREVQHPTLPVTVSEHHALRPFAVKIQEVLNEVGRVLVGSGYSSLGAFLVKVCQGGVKGEELVKVLGDAFPACLGTWEGLVMLAQRLAYYVHKKFPELVKTSPFTTGADPAIVSNLEIQRKLNDGYDFGAVVVNDEDVEAEYSLRAAGVAAVEMMTEAAEKMDEWKGGKLNAMGLCAWLRGIEKVEKRLVNKATLFY